MLILAIETSAVASAALVTDHGPPTALPRVRAEFVTEDTRSHAEVLAPGIRQMLDDAGTGPGDLDAVVAGVGPGPFTGLRSGIVTARTLSFVWNRPLHGMMSLDSVAWRVAVDGVHDDAGSDFLVATDARRKEVYWARYRLADGMPELHDGPHVGPAAGLPQLPVYGAGAGLYADVVDAVPGYAMIQPEAGALGELALLRLAAGARPVDTTPLYLRESDAKVPGPRKRATGAGRS
ncbi:tRNA (adenosine(37)-N6)-threonylcarbamoyltransferase complex dimerization subunit type 1 TsaB [Arthrobacter castelli]|uniref:tRNA (adenosine(37)-N6)-threonylcarbamoyltransferase complex dimerization subunit type 1 TsaB n=1 Tax=Arthrobacter castelli TaxID=271431 RepID=UPI00040F87AE|nr:tRNA (adenosine(37)-N6)-threonylcarbamoyltransferase complex dimerization subunit type 1 TsaB [Arthrobacter castelli]